MDLVARLAELPVLITGCLLALVVLSRRTRSLPAFVLAGAGFLAWLSVATPMGANAWVGLLEDRVATPEACEPMPPGALVIVLAGGIAGDAGALDTSRLSAASLRRVLAAAQVARRAPDSTLILSGGAGKTVREADLMRALMLDLGVAPERLWIERESRNTHENATGVARLVTERNWGSRPVYLLTSAMHQSRAGATFRRAGLATCPILTDSRQETLDPQTAWIPSAQALLNASHSFHEFIGILAYAVTGRL